MFGLSRSLLRHLPNVRGQATNTFVRAKATSATVPSSSNTNDQLIKELEDIDGPGWWWLPMLAGDIFSSHEKIYRDYGREQGVVRVRTSLGEIGVTVFDLEDIKFVFQNEGKDFHGSSQLWPIQNFFIELDGDHLDNLALNLFHSTPRAMITRKLLNPGINSSAVAKYEGLVQDAARNAVEFVNQYKDDIALWTERTAFDMFSSLSLGRNYETVNPDCQSNMKEIAELDATALGLAIRLQYLPKFTHPWRGYEKFRESFERVYKITEEHVENLFGQDQVPLCYFKDLRDEQGLTPKQITGIFTILLSAAVATTRALTQWMLVACAYHPDAQAKLREEIVDLLEDGTYSTSIKMPYMEAFFREAYRLYPTTPGLGVRTLEHDIVLPSSRVRIPAGTPMTLCPIYEARDDEFIPDAHEFKPERFFRENIRSRKGCPMGAKLDSAVTKEPFSAGSRSCLGRRAANLEVRAILCKLLSEYELVLDPPGQPLPNKRFDSTLVPDPFPQVRLVPIRK